MYMLRAHTYLGDEPAACVNCHIMTPYYATWFHSSHARDATCNDCHVPHENAVKKWTFKGVVPVFICVLCITIISVINVCTLNLSEDMRENAVFSVLGLPWGKNSLFSLIQIIITNVISLMFVMMFLILAERTKISEYVYIQLDFWSTVLLILVVVCVCLVYYFVASRMLKKKNPVELLKSDL